MECDSTVLSSFCCAEGAEPDTGAALLVSLLVHLPAELVLSYSCVTLTGRGGVVPTSTQYSVFLWGGGIGTRAPLKLNQNSGINRN